MSTDRSALSRALKVRLAELAGQSLVPVEVAILDSGVDGSHERLRGKVSAAFICESDKEGNVTVAEADPAANNDLFGHGTAVASIVCDLAPNAKIVDIRVLGGNNYGRSEQLIVGFDKAIEHGSRVINMSLAAAARYAGRLTEICERAYFRNQIIVAARRNRPIADEGYPAAFSSTIGVGMGDCADAFEFEFAEHIIEYAARGEEIVVAAPGGGYTTMTGTSFATPTISGIVALLVGASPGLRPFEVKALLKAMSRNEPDLSARYDETARDGMI